MQAAPYFPRAANHAHITTPRTGHDLLVLCTSRCHPLRRVETRVRRRILRRTPCRVLDGHGPPGCSAAAPLACSGGGGQRQGVHGPGPRPDPGRRPADICHHACILCHAGGHECVPACRLSSGHTHAHTPSPTSQHTTQASLLPCAWAKEPASLHSPPPCVGPPLPAAAWGTPTLRCLVHPVPPSPRQPTCAWTRTWRGRAHATSCC